MLLLRKKGNQTRKPTILTLSMRHRFLVMHLININAIVSNFHLLNESSVKRPQPWVGWVLWVVTISNVRPDHLTLDWTMRNMGPGPELIGAGRSWLAKSPSLSSNCSGTVTSWEVVSGGFSKPVILGFPKGKREAVIKRSVEILHAKGQTGSKAWLDHGPQSFIH